MAENEKNAFIQTELEVMEFWKRTNAMSNCA